MRSLRGPGPKYCCVAGVLAWAVAAHGACNGPPAMVAQMGAHPTAENAGMLGSWYASHQQFDCALETFQAGLKVEPRSAPLHYVTGLSLAAMKRPSEAVRELQRSIELDPQEIKPHIILASIYDEMGKPADAEHEWRKALAIDPKSVPVLEGLTSDFMKRQDYASVVQLLQESPRNEKLDIALARAMGLLGDVTGAAAVLKDALQAHPDSLPLAQALLVPMMKQHEHEDAIKLMKATLQKHPGDKDLEVQLLGLLVLGQHMDEARELGPRVLAELPNDPQVLYLNGLAVRSAGENGKAKDLLEKAVALKPDFTNFLYELGSTLVLLKQWPEAKQRLERAIELGATQPEAHLALAKALRALGDTQRATEEMAKYQQIKKDSETILEAAEASAQGDQLLDAGNVSEAVAHYRDAIESEPSNANYQYKLAIALHRVGDAAGERHALEQAVKLDPRLPGAQNALGYLMSRDGDANGAVVHFRATVEAAPGWTEAWINLAAELAVTSNFAEARQAVAKALELDPSNTQARELSDQLARDPAAKQNHI